MIDRAAILGDGRTLEVAHAFGFDQPAPGSNGAEAWRADGEPPDSPPRLVPSPVPPHRLLTLDEAMRRQIEQSLVATRGQIEGPHGAAAVLHINPHTLRARMRKLGIDWTRYRLR